MAAAVLKKKLDTAGLSREVAVDSVGTSGFHVGEDADPRAKAVLAEAGYDIDHRGRQVDPDVFEESDLILAMDAANAADLRTLARRTASRHDHVHLMRTFDPEAGPGAEVPDPYYGGERGFRHVLHVIEKSADGIVEHVRGELRK